MGISRMLGQLHQFANFKKKKNARVDIAVFPYFLFCKMIFIYISNLITNIYNSSCSIETIFFGTRGGRWRLLKCLERQRPMYDWSVLKKETTAEKQPNLPISRPIKSALRRAASRTRFGFISLKIRQLNRTMKVVQTNLKHSYRICS